MSYAVRESNRRLYDEEIDEQQSNNTNGIDKHERKHERTTGEEGRKRHRLKFQVGILVGRRPDRPDSQGA